MAAAKPTGGRGNRWMADGGRQLVGGIHMLAGVQGVEPSQQTNGKQGILLSKLLLGLWSWPFPAHLTDHQ